MGRFRSEAEEGGLRVRGAAGQTNGDQVMNFSVARRNMVDNQVRTNRVTDPVIIAAMANLPREEFVPEPLKGMAYVDDDLPVGSGRYVMEPMVLGRLLQLAELRSNDVVLDIGCATGYSSAILARIAATVLALESDPALAERATRVLAAQGIDNAAVVQGPLPEGYPAQAPYDVILFQGGVPAIPDRIRDQLAEGGRLVAVVEDRGVGHATLIVRSGGVFSHRVAFEAAVARLPGFAWDQGFTF